MHTTDLDELTGQYWHVYLSPHLDDAALSCGGAIAAYQARGEPALVVTLSTAVPEPQQFGPLAEEFRGDWSLSQEEAVSARLKEDLAAMAEIGCDSVWAGLLDSIYRLPYGYDTREKLFGRPVRSDPLYEQLPDYLNELRRRFPTATFYAPLGVGFHVDHQIVFDVAEQVFGGDLAFYEDVYYVIEPGELERRLADIGRAMQPITIDISGTLQRKIRAIDCYASQVPELFGGSERMAQAIAGYAARVAGQNGGYAERVWRYVG